MADNTVRRMQDQRWLLDIQQDFGRARVEHSEFAISDLFRQVVNRCAQGLIMARRQGYEMPEADDPCWEAWGLESERCKHCGRS